MEQGKKRLGSLRNATGSFQFNRMELAGSLGDLGTLLPLAVGMVMVNALSQVGVFFSIGLFYLFSGAYFRVTCPVEPMKVISGYAIATGITATQIQASCLWIFLLLTLLGATGLINVIGRAIPKAVIRGIQLSTGILLLSQGVRFILGTSSLQLLQGSAEPNLVVQTVAQLPIGIVLGVGLGLTTLLLLDNRRLPAAVVVVGAGIVIGILFGSHSGWNTVQSGISLPTLLPYGQLTWNDFSFALLVLVIPQLPMTVGNAVIANADLSAQYFPDSGQRVTYRGLCLSMALASLVSFLFGGMPMCHGAGGLASRYRFGARTAGSNLIIGGLFLGIALLFAQQIMPLVNMLPLAVLGVLLIFAGAQLALTILDMQTRKELFVVVLIVGITLAANLAVGFITGIAVATLLRWERFSV
jgi:SulP family sulfate permease